MFLVATATIGLIICNFAEVQSDSFTLHTNESYLIYPVWAAATKGRLQLQFKTSISDAVLLYTAGRMSYLYVGLHQGKVHCSLKLTGSYLQLGEGTTRWNDDQWHSLSVLHLSGVVEINIDAVSEIELQDSSALQFETVSPLYIGGIPDSVTLQSAVEDASFQGCISNVSAANHSVFLFALQHLQVISTNEATNGCEDICNAYNETCNGGQCYSNWTDSTVVCMCDSFHVGEHCNQDLPFSPIHLSGISYPCHRIMHTKEPYLPDDIVVFISTSQIQTNGVLVTLHNNHSLGLLYTANGFLSYTHHTLHGELFTFKLDSAIPKTGSHLLNLKRSQNRIELLLYTSNILLHKILSTVDPAVFGDIEYLCIGDGTPDLHPYVGEISTVLYNGVILDHKQNVLFMKHKTTVYIPPDFKESIKLWGISFSSGPLSLSFLMESSSGLIIECQFEDNIFNIYNDNGQMVVTSRKYSSNPLVQVCSSISTGTWHVLKIELLMTNRNISELAISLDHEVCNITGYVWTMQLEILKDSTFVLACHLKDVDVNFQGYLSNATLQGGTPLHLESVLLNTEEESIIGSTFISSLQVSSHPSIVPSSSHYNPPSFIMEIPTPELKNNSPVNEMQSTLIISGIAGSVIIIIIIIAMTTMCLCGIRCALMSKYGQYNTRESEVQGNPLMYYNATLRKMSSRATIISLNKFKTNENEYYV